MQLSRSSLGSYLKLFLILTATFANVEPFGQRLAAFESLPPRLVYLALCASLVALVMIAAFAQRRVIRIGYALMFSLSLVVWESYQQITSHFLTYPVYFSLLQAVGFINDVVVEHRIPVFFSIVLGSMLFVGIVLKPERPLSIPGWFLNLGPLLGIVVLSLALYFRGGDGGRGLPGAVVPLAYTNLYVYEMVQGVARKREAVNIGQSTRPAASDIVLLVDESIRGDYLDINSEHGVESKLIGTLPDAKIVNFGLAASISNCSVPTNLTLRYGGTRENYMQINSTMPSLWEYAAKAGLRTVYIDGQRTKSRLQNGMTEGELKYIDEFIQFDNISIVDRDIAAARRIRSLISNDKNELIVVNKLGAHFPLHDKYPDHFMRYTPVLERGIFKNVADTGDRYGLEETASGWLRYRNSYRNTVLWNVGHFFETLFEGSKLDSTVIFYTSDHGQNLHERGEPGLSTHCNAAEAVLSEEGVVPLVAIIGNKVTDPGIEENANVNFNRASHYNIFPTLLILMGYDEASVRTTYGTPLSGIVDDPFSFNARFYARLGKKPVFKTIDIADLPIAIENVRD